MTLQDKVDEFIAYRKAIKKPIRPASLNAFMNRLKALASGNEDDMIEILEQSIANSWQGIFELKDKPKAKPTFIEQAINKQNSLDELFKQIDNKLL